MPNIKDCVKSMDRTNVNLPSFKGNCAPHVGVANIPKICRFYFYARMNIILEEFYNALLMTNKSILINEFRYATCYHLSVSYIPVFTNNYVLKEYYVKFDNNVMTHCTHIRDELRRILSSARQFEDSPFGDLYF